MHTMLVQTINSPTNLCSMKKGKGKASADETGHNVDISPRNTRSAEDGQESPDATRPNEGNRSPRRQVSADS